MKRLLTVGCLTIGLAGAQDRSGLVKVEITGFEPQKGSVLIALYREAGGFPVDGDKAWRRQELKLPKAGDSAIAEWFDLPAGKYAIAAFQDESGTGKLTRNFLGMPLEKWGVSNNVRPKLRAPKFEEAQFEFDGKSKQLEIRLKK